MQQQNTQSAGAQGGQPPLRARRVAHPAAAATPLSHERVRELLGWNLLRGLPVERSMA